MSARSLLIFASLLSSSGVAAPTLDPQIGSHAVIQRGKPIVLSGSAAPGEKVSVSFAGTARQTRASAAGRWEAVFPTHVAGGPYSIEASGSAGSSADSSDVMVGDVWLCSGQSNMEYPLRRALNSDGEVQNAADPDLRLMKVPQQMADLPTR